VKKLLELEQQLIKAKEDLNKIMSSSSTAQGSVNTTGGPSIASQIGFGKAEKKELTGRQKELDTDKDGDIEADDLRALREKKMKKAEHPDEKEDKKLIADAMDRHNEQKHGEPKGEDSAKKALGLKKTGEISYLDNGQWVLEKAKPTKPANPEDGRKQQQMDEIANKVRQPAKVTDASGKVSILSAEDQMKAKADSKASKRAKFEAEAAERRAKMREESKKKV
jgi:hypothetical protein